MSIFDRNLNTELLLAIEYMKVLFSANNALETVLFEVSKQKFGRVSRVFANMLKKNKEGQPLDRIIADYAQEMSSQNFKELLITLNTESSDINQRLSDIAKHIMESKKLAMTNLYNKLNSYFGKVMIVLVVPLLVYLSDILKVAFDVPAEQQLIPENIRIGIIVASAVVLVLMMLMMRYTET